jgi:2-amino-4-hydroxy-6-hydroxymethyldihydropteridine diphosphokinase
MNSLYLSIGSNIEPERNLRECAIAIERLFLDPVWSPVYQSIAVGMDGPDFLNAVVHARTDQGITAVMLLLKNLEQSQGRIRQKNAFTNRTLDVDLLLFNDTCVDTPGLTLPRAEILNTGYVLVPLADLAPNLVHPKAKKTMMTLLHDLQATDATQISMLSKTDWSL